MSSSSDKNRLLLFSFVSLAKQNQTFARHIVLLTKYLFFFYFISILFLSLTKEEYL